MPLLGVRVGGIHQKAARNLSRPICPVGPVSSSVLDLSACQCAPKPIVSVSAPPSLEYFNYASTQPALPAIPTPCSYVGTNPNSLTAYQREQKGRGGVWGGEDARRPIHRHHHILTKFMLQKQHVSLINPIYAIVLPWLRPKFSCTPARMITHLSSESPRRRALSQPPGTWQLSGICWLSPRFSIQTVFPAPNPNRWRGTKSGTLQLPGLPATLPASQWRAAGRNQEGQDTLLMLMTAPITY